MQILVNQKAQQSLGKKLPGKFISSLAMFQKRCPKVVFEAAGGPEVINTKFSHPLVEAAHMAYSQHYPLTITPDAVWLTIIQGLARHINANAEELRNQFVDFDGKKYIEITRDGSWVRGNPNNDWSGVFPEFSDRLAEFIGRKRDLIVSNFSTTTPIDKIASEIVLMEAMQEYFEYGMMTMCGIPSINLMGTVEDWKEIKDRISVFENFNLDWWLQHLEPVIDFIVDSMEGKPDINFWDSLYKVDDSSGGPYISGWINTLFPYPFSSRDNSPYERDRSQSYATIRNEYMDWAKPTRYFQGMQTSSFFNGLSSVPFKWKIPPEEHEMQFLGGLIGVTQDPQTLALQPVSGWAVAERND